MRVAFVCLLKFIHLYIYIFFFLQTIMSVEESDYLAVRTFLLHSKRGKTHSLSVSHTHKWTSVRLSDRVKRQMFFLFTVIPQESALEKCDFETFVCRSVCW